MWIQTTDKIQEAKRHPLWVTQIQKSSKSSIATCNCIIENKYTLLHLPFPPEWPQNALGTSFKPYIKSENLVRWHESSFTQFPQVQKNAAPSESDAKTQNQVPWFQHCVPVLAFHWGLQNWQTTVAVEVTSHNVSRSPTLSLKPRFTGAPKTKQP